MGTKHLTKEQRFLIEKTRVAFQLPLGAGVNPRMGIVPQCSPKRPIGSEAAISDIYLYFRNKIL
jgi:hypothetical protein